MEPSPKAVSPERSGEESSHLGGIQSTDAAPQQVFGLLTRMLSGCLLGEVLQTSRRRPTERHENTSSTTVFV